MSRARPAMRFGTACAPSRGASALPEREQGKNKLRLSRFCMPAQRTLNACLLLAALLAAQPATIPDLEASARQRLAAHDAAGALAAYEKLAEMAPKSAVYQDQIGFLLAATNRSADAIPHFRHAIDLDPKMAQAWFHLGAALWLTQQAEPAVDALRNAVRLAPENGDYRFRLGTIYNETGQSKEAARELARASRLAPSNAKIWETLGSAYERRHLFKEARDAYRQA